MNSTIDYTMRAEAIRATLALPAQGPKYADLIAAEQSRLLHRIEVGIADALRAGGVASDVAAQSAFEFVRQCVAHYRG